MRRETRVDTHCRQVAQTVGHVMLDHMLFSGVMHRNGRQHGEERVKHESKKENIAAVHARYCNNGNGVFPDNDAKVFYFGLFKLAFLGFQIEIVDCEDA